VRTTYVWTGIRSAAVGTRDPFAYELAHVHAEADRLLTEALGGWAEEYPDVLVERSAVFDANVRGGDGTPRRDRGPDGGVNAQPFSAERADHRIRDSYVAVVPRCPVAVIRPPVVV
jgi:hypothetical protein